MTTVDELLADEIVETPVTEETVEAETVEFNGAIFDEEGFASVREAAKAMGIGVHRTRELLKTKELAGDKAFTGFWRVHKDNIVACLEARAARKEQRYVEPNPMTNRTKGWVTIKQAAEYLKISVAHMRNVAKAGEVDSRKNDNFRWEVRATDVRAYTPKPRGHRGYLKYVVIITDDEQLEQLRALGFDPQRKNKPRPVEAEANGDEAEATPEAEVETIS